MVVMDKSIEQGIKYLEKYEFWDEVSIGGHYSNEHNISYLNKQEVPGIPHILIFKDKLVEGGFGVTILEERGLLLKLMGADEIVEWVNSDFKIVSN